MPVIKDVLDSLKTIEELHRKKNDDYSTDANPFSNFDITAEGIKHFNNPKDVAFAWPIYNKLARLSNLLSKDTAPNNESVEDSLIDIATYCLLWKADIKRRNEPLYLGIDWGSKSTVSGDELTGNILNRLPAIPMEYRPKREEVDG